MNTEINRSQTQTQAPQPTMLPPKAGMILFCSYRCLYIQPGEPVREESCFGSPAQNERHVILSKSIPGLVPQRSQSV